MLIAATALTVSGCMQVKRLADWSEDADGGDTDVIAMGCGACLATGVDLADLRCAIDLCDPSVVLNGDGEYTAVTDYRSSGMSATCARDDTREAIARFGDAVNDLAPRLNDSYAILATGDWDSAYHDTSCSPFEAADGDAGAIQADGYGSGDMYDAVEWKLDLSAPSNARSFSFDYVFFSAEYDEGISNVDEYNDKFYVLLEAASTNGGAPTVINTTACRDESSYYDFECTEEIAAAQECALGQKYCYIAINSALSECCWYNGCPDGTADTSIAGTGFECAPGSESDSAGKGSSTGWLRTVWPIDPGEEFTITFHIHDTGDSTRDSAAIVDAFQFHKSFNSGGTVVVD